MSPSTPRQCMGGSELPRGTYGLAQCSTRARVLKQVSGIPDAGMGWHPAGTPPNPLPTNCFKTQASNICTVKHGSIAPGCTVSPDPSLRDVLFPRIHRSGRTRTNSHSSAIRIIINGELSVSCTGRTARTARTILTYPEARAHTHT
jgi:hypothetical protein